MTEQTTKGAAEEVSAVSSNSEAFFMKNKKAIIGAIVVVLVVIAGIFVYRTYIAAPRAEKASTELAKSQELFNNEQFDKAGEGFLKIINNYSGTDSCQPGKPLSRLVLCKPEQVAGGCEVSRKFLLQGRRYDQPFG